MKSIAPFTIIFLICLVSSLTTSQAAPVAEQERTPIDLRRTTLVVRDIDNSLQFYRDALGMKVTGSMEKQRRFLDIVHDCVCNLTAYEDSFILKMTLAESYECCVNALGGADGSARR